MPGGDETRADEDRPLETKKPVGDPAAGQRCQINAESVDPDDGRCLAAIKSPSAVGKRSRHEKHEERTETIVGEPLPHLGEEECGESYRMPEEGSAAWSLKARRGLVVGYGPS